MILASKLIHDGVCELIPLQALAQACHAEISKNAVFRHKWDTHLMTDVGVLFPVESHTPVLCLHRGANRYKIVQTESPHGCAEFGNHDGF